MDTFDMVSITPAELTVVAGFLYALAGTFDGLRNGEKFDVLTFAKTIILTAVTGGVISQATADSTTQLITSAGGATGLIVIVDNLINNLIGKYARTTKPVTTASTPVA